MGLFDFLGGIERQVNTFDSNRTYKNKKGNVKDKRSAARQVGDAGFSFLGSVAEPFAKLGNEAGAFYQLVQPTRASIATREKEAIKFLAPNGGILNKGGVLQGRELADRSIVNKQDLAAIAGTGVQGGLTVAAPGVSNVAEKGVTAAVGAAAPHIAEEAVKRAALRQAVGVGGDVVAPGVNKAIQYGAAPVAGAALGAPFNVATTAANGGSTDPKDLLRDAVTGGLFGAALGAGGAAAGAAGRAGISAARGAHPLNEVGAVGRNLSNDELTKLKAAKSPGEVKTVLKDLMTEAEINRITPGIIHAKDSNIIRNLVDNHSLPARSEVTTFPTPTTVEGAPKTAGQGSFDIIPPKSKVLNTKIIKATSGPSADEGKVFYHGTSNTDLKALSDLKPGRGIGKSSTNMTYITENPEIAKNFGDNVISGKVYGKHLNVSELGNAFDPIVVPKDFADYKTSSLLSERDKRVFENQYLRGQADNRIIDATPDIHKYLVSKGYSTITVPRVHSDVNGARTETVIIDPKATTPPASRIPTKKINATTTPTEKSASAPATKTSPQQLIIDALNGKPASKGQAPAKGVRTLAAEQKASLSQERGQRFAAAQNASKDLSGTEAHIAELKSLRGKYSKKDWGGLKEQLGGDDAAEGVYSQLRQQVKDNKNLSYTDGLNTDIALRKLVLGEGLPTAGDIRRLEAVFGTKELDQISRHVSKFRQAQDLGKQLLGVPRALMASSDVSFGGRQALAYATAHPVEFAKQWTKQFKYLKEGLQNDDAVALNKAFKEIQSHPDYDLARKAGLAITDVVGHNPGTREEQFIAGNLAAKIPAAGRLVRGSDHAFTGLANNIRANSFYSLIDQARAAGYNVDDKFASQIARVVNNGTGRGSLKGLDEHMGTLSTVLFAPRLMLSRLNTIFNPVYYAKTNPVARKEALRQLFGLGAFATGILGLAHTAGLKVGTDPTNSDFGKIKVGDTRLDFLGGYAQYIKLAAQIIEGKTTSSLTGKESKLGSGYGEKSVKDILYSFFENKENPIASFATGLAKGTDIVGNPTRTAEGLTKGVIERMVPLLWQDLNDLRTHPESSSNPALLVAGPVLGATGAGVQTYGMQDIKIAGKNGEYLDKLKADKAPKEQIDASTQFFQLSKTGPDRKKYGDKIKEALKGGDEQKAIKLAKQYNDEYASVFDDWRKEHGQYRNDENLVKEYTSNRITGESLLRWYNSVKSE